MTKVKYDFRDVSAGLKKLRDFLLGRKHNLHGRFPPLVAPRSIPPPDIPRGPWEYKYSKQYYYERHALNSVKPPVVAPVAEGPPIMRDPTKKAGTGGISPECESQDPGVGNLKRRLGRARGFVLRMFDALCNCTQTAATAARTTARNNPFSKR
ncbi:uncharacterized protein [Epargyreus clarus]|uniref:uncharacterized protein isoform X1 n=1 Tax=Epargyreus clarus TaxID=520877 RepID=UPI003C2F8CB6